MIIFNLHLTLGPGLTPYNHGPTSRWPKGRGRLLLTENLLGWGLEDERASNIIFSNREGYVEMVVRLFSGRWTIWVFGR